MRDTNDFLLRPKRSFKRLAAGFRPDRQGSQQRSPRPIAALGRRKGGAEGKDWKRRIVEGKVDRKRN